MRNDLRIEYAPPATCSQQKEMKIKYTTKINANSQVSNQSLPRVTYPRKGLWTEMEQNEKVFLKDIFIFD